MTTHPSKSAGAMAAVLISAAALVLSSLALWSNTLNRQQQRQITIAQKRTEIVLALHDIELTLEPLIRELKMFVQAADPESQKLQSGVDTMIDYLDQVQLLKKRVTDEILPEESSHKVLLTLEPIRADVLQLAERTRTLRAEVEILISKFKEARDSRDEP